MSAAGTYLYAVTRPLEEGAFGDLSGIDGAPVRVVSAGDVACVVSSVGWDEFGEGPLQRNLEDLGWLERVAREHDAVVRAVSGRTVAVPLRMATVCADDDSAAARVHRLRSAALATLDVLDGREEWGVKVHAVRRPQAEAVPPPSSGLEYLRRRRGELDRRADDARVLAEDADAVFERLRALAVLARRHRPQDPVLSGSKHPMLLNAAFLVDRAARPRFRHEVDSLAGARPDGAMVLTGPWPPYSFATLDDA